MLKPLRASTRAVSTLQRASLPKCDRHRIAARIGQLRRWEEGDRRPFTSLPIRKQDAPTSIDPESPLQAHEAPPPNSAPREEAKKLPVVCPGCGAPSQTVDSEAAGFYGSKRAERATQKNTRKQEEDEIFNNALNSGAFAGDTATQTASTAETPQIPICDRCHYLLYQSRGTSIIHPSMHSIQQIIEESPHKQNHIYHVLDAADFPLSLIPNLVSALQLPRLRTQNRRSKSMQYIRGRAAEVSFIITRADLLAPKKEQVDSLVPYLRDVLRDALGRSGRNVRLGNVRCVSAHRGWWTKSVKEDIWNRGGAGWVIGKVNVGKSALYEVVFPKGRNQQNVNVNTLRAEEKKTFEEGLAKLGNNIDERNAATQEAVAEQKAAFADSSGELLESLEPPAESKDSEGLQESELDMEGQDMDGDHLFDDASLLPPAQPETAYPRMPLVSSLPGTTASPIRIPFGNGRGELIDLPGVERSSLDVYVKPEHRDELMMRSRVVPQQYTIKPGQSLLLGGLIRITPKTEDLIFLAYPFVPLKPHITSNDKAVGIQSGLNLDGEPYSGTVESVATDKAKQTLGNAGTFKLEWDVTKRRSGPLTDRAAGKQKAANLPFIVYSTDLLIEGVGWVELTCQVRNRRKSFITETVIDAFGQDRVKNTGPAMPEVEVWSPEGKFVGARRPMNAWVLGGPKKVAKHATRFRPRQTISFQRRKEGGARGGAPSFADAD